MNDGILFWINIHAPNMHGLPQLVNVDTPLYGSPAGFILIFAALICICQLLVTYFLTTRVKAAQTPSTSSITAMEYLALAMVCFGSVVMFWVVPRRNALCIPSKLVGFWRQL